MSYVENKLIERNKMTIKLHLDISKQPDDITCGPACLHSVYDYYGDFISLQQVITEVKSLEGGEELLRFFWLTML